MAGGSDDATRDQRGGGADTRTAGASTHASAAISPTLSDTGSRLGDRALADTQAQPAVAPDLVGKTLDRYRVLARLGAGGMGVVYAALDPALDRRVALKVLPPVAAHRGLDLEARLRREAQALARLDHPNVVRVYDVGVAEHSVYVAMQLVDGHTVAEWLEETKPPARRILALFAGAARGLAAAHEAGIVHRDVKPSNLLVDRAGRVYVGDFGLARGAGDDDGNSGARVSTSSDSNLLDEAMTREGSVLGTPLYMSPEQHRGGIVTARSDQYSFCVSLWQALFGEHPFVRGRWVLATALDAMIGDAVRDPPGGRGVPARVVRALRRGMRFRPEERWPSMAALADRLVPRSRTAWVAAGLALAGIAGGLGLATALGVGGGGDPCDAAGARLATSWGGATASQLRVSFASSNLPYAPGLADQAVARIDRYARDWSAMRVDACRATRDRGEQSDNMLDRRMRCLDRRLAELDGVVQILVRAPGGDVVDRSLSLIEGLPSLDECADTAALAELVEAAASPAQRAEIAAVDGRIARLRVNVDAGIGGDHVADADALVAAARRLADPALLGRALVLAGDARYFVDQVDPAIPIWREGAAAASRAHDDSTAVQALRMIGSALDQAGKPDQALIAIGDAEIYASRGSIDANLLSDVLISRGSSLDQLGRYAESDDAYRRAIELEERAHGADSWTVAETLVDQAKVLNDTGRYAEAVAALGRAIPILERKFGSSHPDLAIAHQNLGNAYMFLGRQADARRELEAALAIKRARFPVGTATIGASLQSLGSVELDIGDLAAAERDTQEALDIRTHAFGPDHPQTLASRYQLGVLRRTQGRYDEARALLEQVLAARVARYGEMHTSVANVRDAIANCDQAAGKLDDAIDQRRRSLAIREQLLGPYGDDVQLSLLGLAELAMESGRCAEAQGEITRVLQIQTHNGAEWWSPIAPLSIGAVCEDRAPALGDLRAKLEPLVTRALAGDDVDRKADALFALGVVQWKQGERARGRALVEQSIATYRAAGQPGSARLMSEWLRTHAAPR